MIDVTICLLNTHEFINVQTVRFQCGELVQKTTSPKIHYVVLGSSIIIAAFRLVVTHHTMHASANDLKGLDTYSRH